MNSLKMKVLQIVALHRQRTKRWHNKTPAVTSGGVLGLIEKNHLCNFLLWHEEDRARRDDKGFEYVYLAKRAIDRLNQDRNDFIEGIDQAIADDSGPFPAHCPMHSETPGMIIDRLSILALKSYHMAELANRVDIDETQRARCATMLATLEEQHRNLVAALDAFFAEIQGGTRAFRVFRQCKQYNDPAFNPELKAAERAKGD